MTHVGYQQGGNLLHLPNRPNLWFGIITIVPFLIYRNPCTRAEMQESFNDYANEHVMHKIYLVVDIVIVISGEG